MRTMRMACTLAGVVLSGVVSGVALAQAPMAPPPVPGPAGEVQRSYAAQKDNLLKTAEITPADLYQYKPTPEVRTFARMVNHVTEAQVRACGEVNGTPPAERMKTPADTADKATIVAGLKASFAECVGPAKRTRAGVLWGNVSHDNEQYSALSMYLRLKGLAPPTSEK